MAEIPPSEAIEKYRDMEELRRRLSSTSDADEALAIRDTLRANAKWLMTPSSYIVAYADRVSKLESALRRARDDMEGWAAYASDYFREKWGLDEDLAAIDAALADAEKAK